MNTKYRTIIINLFIASLWGYYAYKSFSVLNIDLMSHFQGLFPVTLFIRNSTLTIMFLSRRPSKRTSTSPFEWFIAIYGTFIGYFYVFNGPADYFPWTFILGASIVKILISVLMITAIFSLGRSFGIVPSDRGIKTGGLYRYVRHPIYSLYLLSDLIDMIAGKFFWQNALVFLSFILTTYFRTVYEERLLERNPKYSAYKEKTPYRLLPGLF